MDTTIRNTLVDLFYNLVSMIAKVDVPKDIRGRAVAVVEYYLFNPINAKEVGFFTRNDIEWTPFHTHAAPVAYVPMLTHMLNSAYVLLLQEIERLEMLGDLNIRAETISTPDQLKTRFVYGLAEYSDLDHEDYDSFRSVLINSIFKEREHDIRKEEAGE